MADYLVKFITLSGVESDLVVISRTPREARKQVAELLDGEVHPRDIISVEAVRED